MLPLHDLPEFGEDFSVLRDSYLADEALVMSAIFASKRSLQPLCPNRHHDSRWRLYSDLYDDSTISNRTKPTQRLAPAWRFRSI